MRHLIREPLVQFLLVGLVLFGAWQLAKPAHAARDASNRIVITEDDLKQMAVGWAAQGLPPPSPQQMKELIDARVREEVLYREALALGLDKDDAIVRRQLARKMEFVAEDLSKLEEPKPEELRAWYEKSRARFALPPRVTFRHVYFSPDRRGANTRTDAVAALTQLSGKPIDASVGVGDTFMFQSFYGDRSMEVLAKEFGPAFARALVDVAPGAWAGPVESGYGWHLVFIDSMTPQQIPEFDAIEQEVRNAWVEEHREKTRASMYESMRARYEVVLPGS
ncbi:MAG: peptidyl-prolyl cis-trans isomerase [Dechloromonas sp.]|nr:peptidyl-prolyl cis-trans isomerase [Dechloromonas sp.]